VRLDELDEEDMDVSDDKIPFEFGDSPATELGRSYLPRVLDRLNLTFEDEFVGTGINDLLLLLADLTRCGLLCPGLRANNGNIIEPLILGKFGLCNAFGAHALLAKLTMVTGSEKKSEFGLCTKEANVPLDDFAFEIRCQTFKFCARKRTSDVSKFRM